MEIVKKKKRDYRGDKQSFLLDSERSIILKWSHKKGARAKACGERKVEYIKLGASFVEIKIREVGEFILRNARMISPKPNVKRLSKKWALKSVELYSLKEGKMKLWAEIEEGSGEERPFYLTVVGDLEER